MRPATTPNPLPREIAPGVYWLGKCNGLADAEGRGLHSYNSAYLIIGDQHTALVDTGMPGQWAFNDQLDMLLKEKELPAPRYAFVTHSEMAHIGGLGWLLAKYPDLTAHGDVTDLHLVWPEYADRLYSAEPDDRFDLGGTEVVVTESVFRDLVGSRWFFDTKRAVLFPADGFAVAHYHADNACGRFVEEVPELDVEDGLRDFAFAAFYWTRFVDTEPFARRLTTLVLEELQAGIVAPAHGLPIMDAGRTLQRVRVGLSRMGDVGERDATAKGGLSRLG